MAPAILTGWTSVMVAVWFLSGTVLISTGTLGIYVSRLCNEITLDQPLE